LLTGSIDYDAEVLTVTMRWDTPDLGGIVRVTPGGDHRDWRRKGVSPLCPVSLRFAVQAAATERGLVAGMKRPLIDRCTGNSATTRSCGMQNGRDGLQFGG
jgi:hypothetical protein